MNIQIINGPNLNLLGKREPSIYGNVTFDDYLKKLRLHFSHLQIEYFQSNIEGELIGGCDIALEMHQQGQLKSVLI